MDKNVIRDELKNPHKNVVRMLLKLIAYDNDKQNELLPDKWEIEHILPNKWQSSYFPSSSEEEVNGTIEHLGNKIPFEKKLNIIASNGYFEKKKELYKQSKIYIVKELSESNVIDWQLEQIRERNIRLADRIIEIFDEWSADQAGGKDKTLTDEERKLIESLRSKGVEIKL